MKATLYYKSTCGTCRKVLAALQAKKVDVHIVDYVNNPPTPSELDTLLKKLRMQPIDLVRKKESLYQQKYANKDLTRAEWLKVLHAEPILIERPIVVMGDRAIVARPPERLSELPL